MAYKKKPFTAIDQNKITFPADLIPRDVTRFSIEAMDDGRLILSPIPPADQVSSGSQIPVQQFEKPEGLAEVIDIRLGRTAIE